MKSTTQTTDDPEMHIDIYASERDIENLHGKIEQLQDEVIALKIETTLLRVHYQHTKAIERFRIVAADLSSRVREAKLLEI